MIVEPVTLHGHRVRLEPLGEHHREALASAISDGQLWEIPVTMVPHPNELDAFYARVAEATSCGRELAFATIDMERNMVVGSTRFMSIDVAHRRAEIGFTFLATSAQRTHINTEAKYLMLRHAFEQWKVNRIEFITDVLNTTSRAAIERIGATHEGTLRNHFIMRGGRLRDSMMYSIIASEWPVVKRSLEQVMGLTR
ncbi:GNAT family protein [soil metagenome]